MEQNAAQKFPPAISWIKEIKVYSANKHASG